MWGTDANVSTARSLRADTQLPQHHAYMYIFLTSFLTYNFFALYRQAYNWLQFHLI